MKDNELHMAGKPEEKMWYDGQKYIPVTELTDVYLRRAKLYAQKKQLEYFRKEQTFTALIEMLEEEAERRGIKMRDYKSGFHKNTRQYKKRQSQQS